MRRVFKVIVSLSVVAVITMSCGNAENKVEKKNEKKHISPKKVEVVDSAKTASVAKFDFENYAKDKLPEGWSQYFNGRGDTEWKVVDDNGNKVMAQLYSDNPNSHFNVVVNDGLKTKNLTLKVRLKGVTGKHDQGGGFVWRFIDKDNYYVVRANPLEDNMVLYKVENGKRTDLPLMGKGRTYGTDVPKLGNGWNDMKLVVVDDIFTVYLNGKELFRVQDSTFTQEGKVGFWTKADAVTYFDDFEVVEQ
jgi:hypothetical protein